MRWHQHVAQAPLVERYTSKDPVPLWIILPQGGERRVHLTLAAPGHTFQLQEEPSEPPGDILRVMTRVSGELGVEARLFQRLRDRDVAIAERQTPPQKGRLLPTSGRDVPLHETGVANEVLGAYHVADPDGVDAVVGIHCGLEVHSASPR